jgi:MFS family permease
MTSLITDVSSEMVTAVIPLYLTTQVGFSVGAFGLFEGSYQASSALLRLWGASVADRTSRHKEVATAGYAVSAATRVGLLASVSGAVSPVPFLLVDRMGKGIRAAPRDALISLSADPAVLGTAFGIHRAMDTLGALAGPLVAFFILDLAPGAFDAVFVVSALAAFIGVLVIGLLAQPVRVERSRSERAASMVQQLRAVWHIAGVARLAVVAGGLAVVTVSDAFVYLVVQRDTSMDPRLFPLLFAGTAVCYLALAVPFGRLADRFGRRQIFLAGHLPLIALYTLLVRVELTTGIILLCLLLLGVYWAATDGVITALASSLVPDRHRGAGIAAVTVCIAVGRLLSSALFGVVWSFSDADTALTLFAAGLAVGLVLGARALTPAARPSLPEMSP